MAKGKSLNPAEALRKAQRKKELKKNKDQRQKTRAFNLVKKDTFELEDEINELEKLSERTKAQNERLTELKSELENITKKKEEYVEEHPEARNLVFKRRRDKPKDDDDEEKKAEAAAGAKKKRNLFNKNGLPRHPERSIYYDPVMNPYGMPPPGLPYAERALLHDEVDSEAEEAGKDASDSDDDIPMPEGPPPGAPNDDGESDDDIPLPEGPPPGEEENSIQPPLPPGLPPLPPGAPPQVMPPFAPNLPPFFPMVSGMPLPPPPPGPIPGQSYPVAGFSVPPPPPPMVFPFPQNNLLPRLNSHSRRGASSGWVQDPLSDQPHKTFQAFRAERHSGASTENADTGASTTATVSAEPQLRDFKKESTAFVPAALKRKKAGGTGGGKINAAPSVSSDAGNGEANEAGETEAAAAPKPDLLGSLRDKFGPMTSTNASMGSDANSEKDGDQQTKKRKVQKSKDDYDKFLEEMGELLDARR
ncbi:hypothetical protein ACEPAI_35 [Sanghuangporus weigelae]